MNIRDIYTRLFIKGMITMGNHQLNIMHRNTVNARKRNEELLFHILKTNANSEYGKKMHFSDIHSVEDYRRNVPLSTFQDYEEYIKRMIDGGESNLITSLPLVGYAQSSGSVGARKLVPLTQPQVNIYVRYTVPKMLALADRYHRQKYGKGLKPGRGMFTPPAFDDYLPNGMLCSNVADVAARQLGFCYPYILLNPFTKLFNASEADSKYMNFRLGLEDPNLMYMFSVFFMNFTDLIRYLEINWKTIVDDIETGTISDLGMASEETKKKLAGFLKPNPTRAAELRKEFEKGFDNTIIPRLWPNMSVMYGIGSASFWPFVKICRGYTGDIPYDFSIYGASEGLFASTDYLNSLNQLLLVDSCYYEFIPMEDESRILSLDELEVGKEYEIIITSQAGLYRYRCGDVIKVVDYMNECPYILFSFRKGQLLNLTGEKTTEEHMATVVHRLEKISGTRIPNWAVASDYEAHPYSYILLTETEDGTDLSGYAAEMTEILKEANVRFARFHMEHELGDLRILNQKPGTHERWKELCISRGTSSNQYKPVHILDSDEKTAFFMNSLL